MNCYVCDDRGDTRAAVAICHNCSVGLCREHLDADLTSVRRTGHTVARGCSHHPGLKAKHAKARPRVAAPGGA